LTMMRIDIPSVERMSVPDRRQYNRFPSNLVRALLKTRGCTPGYLDLGFALIDANVDTRRRELVILRVAALSDSAYERMQHLPQEGRLVGRGYRRDRDGAVQSLGPGRWCPAALRRRMRA
jgi:hypothetical protein